MKNKTTADQERVKAMSKRRRKNLEYNQAYENDIAGVEIDG